MGLALVVSSMEKYVSRRYLKEKWEKAKWDMEIVLEVENKDLSDKVDYEDVKRVKDNIVDMLCSIIRELS